MRIQTKTPASIRRAVRLAAATILAVPISFMGRSPDGTYELAGAVARAALAENLDLNSTQWWYFYNTNATDLGALLNSRNARLVSLQVESTSPLLFSGAMVQNTGTFAKAWTGWWYGQTAAQLTTLLQQNNARIAVLSPYVVNGSTLFAAALVGNTGPDAKAWWWYYGKSSSQIGPLLQQNNARLVELRQYVSNGSVMYAFVMNQNTGADQTAWWWYPNQSPAQIATLLQQNNAYLVSIEAANAGGTAFDVVMNATLPNVFWWWYTGLDTCQLSAALAHGARVLDLKSYFVNGLRRFALILVNDSPVDTSSASAQCTQLAVSANGITRASVTVPTNNSFAYAVYDGDLNGATGSGDVTFAPGAFPPGQTTIVYDLPYGTGEFDVGGPGNAADVPGNWPCVGTDFVALSGSAGQTITASVKDVEHVVRYVEGTCRLNIPWAPLFLDGENKATTSIQQKIPGYVGLRSFEVAQPQFRGRGSNIEAGFLFEADYQFKFPTAGLGPVVGEITVDPAYKFGVDPSNGLLLDTVLNENISPSSTAESHKADAKENIEAQTTSTEALVSGALTKQVSSLLGVFGMSSTLLDTSCTTPNQPSMACFTRTQQALTIVGASNSLAQKAANAIRPANFTCDATSQCAFHPTFQAVNVLPNSVEFVLSPDLTDTTGDALTPFYSALPASVVSAPLVLNGTTMNVALNCAPVPSGKTSGSITTVFSGDTDLGAGIQCGRIAEFH